MSEKSIVGSFYGSADPARRSRPGRADPLRAARARRRGVDLIELDEVETAYERLRNGEGDRSVVILDEQLAGAAPRSAA